LADDLARGGIFFFGVHSRLLDDLSLEAKPNEFHMSLIAVRVLIFDT